MRDTRKPSRTHGHRRAFRPGLELMEDRVQPGSLFWGLPGIVPAADFAALDLGRAAREQDSARLEILDSEASAFWAPDVDQIEVSAPVRVVAAGSASAEAAPRATVPFQASGTESPIRSLISPAASGSDSPSALLLATGVNPTPGVIRESAIVSTGSPGGSSLPALQEFAGQVVAAPAPRAESVPVDLHRVDILATTVRFDPEGGGTIQSTAVYVTYFGQNESDSAAAIAVDAANNTYATGYYGEGADRQVLVTKINALGQLEWATTLGRSSNDEGKGIAVDGDGNVYVVGFYTEDVLGDQDALIARLFPDGSLDYALAAKSAGNDSFNGITLVGDNFFVTGELESATIRLLAARLALDGTVVYAYEYSFRDDSTTGKAIAADALGNVYLAGTITDTAFDSQVLMMSLDGAGDVRYGSILLNGGADAGLGIAYYETDEEARIAVTGFVTEESGESIGIIWRARAEDGARVNLSGIRSSGRGSVVSSAIVVNSAGTAIITGWIDVQGQGLLAMLAQIGPLGTLDDLYAINGSGDDVGLGICLGNGNNVYVVGRTSSEDFPVTRDSALQPDYGGGLSDAWGGLFDL